MRVNHDVLDRLQDLLADRPATAERRHEEGRQASGHTVRPAAEPGEAIDRFSPSGDWDRLIDQVQGVAQHFRAIEKRIHGREIRVEQLLARAEEELNAAAERVRLAEARAEETQAWAERQIAQAEERALAAQGRAQALESLFTRMREVVLAEAPREPEIIPFGRQKASAVGAPQPSLPKVA